jgi:tetratricopeptide (TPR) repeat protein
MKNRKSPVAAARAPSIEARLRGLPPVAAQQVRTAMRALEAGDVAGAELAVFAAAVLAPAHPEVLRWAAQVMLRQGRLGAADEQLRLAIAQLPADPDLLLARAALAFQRDEHALAQVSLREAATRAVDADTHLRVAAECDRQGFTEEALAAAERALAAQPQSITALLQRGRCQHALGQSAEASATFRAVLARKPDSAAAWFSLVDQKTARLEERELAALAQAEARGAASVEDRVLLSFALGKALEDAGQPAGAFAALERANRLARSQRPWDAGHFSRLVDAVIGRHSGAVARAPDGQGAEVVFVVGLPRSGTTLIEQVLAAHPRVEGASELPYLQRVVNTHSQACSRPFPDWVGDATPAQWQAMGQDYLRQSARWRERKPVSTDKMPSNWLLAGAALSMLPDCRVIALYRDPVETTWSCYKQMFARDAAGFAYDFADLAAYWRDFDRYSRFLAAREPRRFRIQGYEAFVADPEGQTRALLDFCGLPFDPACLRFHEAQRSVRTASAGQVRQPLRRDTARTAAYGDLLDPLRALFAAP